MFEFTFGRYDDMMALPLSIILVDQGKCKDCGNHHGYRFEIGVAMFYIRFTFGGDGHDINEDFIG